jgi:hypothetical protein
MATGRDARSKVNSVRVPACCATAMALDTTYEASHRSPRRALKVPFSQWRLLAIVSRAAGLGVGRGMVCYFATASATRSTWATSALHGNRINSSQPASANAAAAS